MLIGLTKRMLFETDKRLLWKLVWNMGIKGIRSVQKHKKRLKKGEFFPPYLYISIINSCNLRCQGCWVDVDHKQQKIDVPAMNRMITTAKKMGNSFFGLLGGEPFMHKELFDVLEAHPDAYFQVFTNGHFITDEVAKRLRKCGNVTVLVSVEGSEIVSDTRRGKEGVYSATMKGIENCLKNKVMTGVCTSLCQSNFDELLTEKWVDNLIEMGVLYTWFHIYRPVGPDSNPDLALTPQQQRVARQFVVDMRCKKPIIFIDAYYDADGHALCPAATGFTHHINPWGDVEPCPIIQFAKESIHDERPLDQVFNESEYLRDFRKTAAEHTRGCIVLERPDLIESLADRHGAKDSTARKKALAELQAAAAHSSQYAPGSEPIPEKSWAYRLAKKFAYHDYGVYDEHFKEENWIDPNDNPREPGESELVQLG
ncbi:radical SAM protein [Mariniblastus fucicola]|uniref:Pyrroloquinoline quinone biosynthesis protein PqqE n=1 Tax=Mariniblastus fucicola TaxID=980251 RepID=A0A5B9P5Y0_9BACT|nr:radical SAM/SPASM domain-containing protein [Mariniblastus fucicola]QEG20585.1 pyrroloquinoline quinone biosynthesis protein PqqE [Mariniblastus fucicola]